MKKITTSLAAVLITMSSNAFAHEDHSMKEQAKQDWQEIKDTAGEAANTTAEWGKSVGRKAADLGKEAADKSKELGAKAKTKANELTDKARDAAKKDAAEEAAEPKGKRFFY